MTGVLEVRGLHAGYGPVEVLHGIDLGVATGEVVVVLGANGAGKTTMMRAVSGTIARRGAVLLDGKDITKTSPDAIVRAGVAQVPQGRGTFVDLTVEDNLRVGAYTRPDDSVADDIARWIELFPRLAERRTQRAGGLSGGEQQMLAVARALMSRPRLLLCDEPSLGLAPIIVQELFAILGRLNRDEGLSILLVEQNANLAMEIANRAYLLETGSIVTSGDADTIRNDDAIRKAYLGY
ncbi:MAG TPA: ABC transporter ATP-binding protein [Acidimicrobiales bacterium]|nr:ABC transporter ATP-binding protein [Acidimicrobiales bacterium]